MSVSSMVMFSSLGVVGIALAFPRCIWRPPQVQGVCLGVQRHPLDAMPDEASAIQGTVQKIKGVA